MFTGIVEEIGEIRSIRHGSRSAVLSIQCEKVLEGTSIGDSIAVNGVCLTVTQLGSGSYCADVMSETLHRSSLGALKSGSRVNLERAMPADGRFGGHIVAGHIDGTGKIVSVHKDEIAVWYRISAEQGVLRYIVEKGSVAIDGISLTVAEVTENEFQVSVIPHTLSNTVLADRVEGDLVNLETDIIGKYVEKLMSGQKPEGCESKITREFLAEHGF